MMEELLIAEWLLSLAIWALISFVVAGAVYLLSRITTIAIKDERRQVMKWCGINGVYKDVSECKRVHAICECGKQRYAPPPAEQAAPTEPEKGERVRVRSQND